MPQTIYRGYTIQPQQTLYDGELRYRYQITKLGRDYTNLTSEFIYPNGTAAISAAIQRIDNKEQSR